MGCGAIIGICYTLIGKQEAEVVDRQAAHGVVVVADGCVNHGAWRQLSRTERTLLVLELDNAAFDAVFDNHAFDCVSGRRLRTNDGAVLAQAVDAVHGLYLDGRIPPRVHEVHSRSLGQVECHAACLERDEKDAHARVFHKMADRAVACLGRHVALQAADAEPGALQAEGDEIEEVDKLTEHQALDRAVRQLAQLGKFLDERLDLGARAPAAQVDAREDALALGIAGLRNGLRRLERRRV